MFITIYLVIGAIVAGFNAWHNFKRSTIKDDAKRYNCSEQESYQCMMIGYVLDFLLWPITVMGKWGAICKFMFHDEEP